MARVRFAVAARKARKKLLKMTKGYWGRRKNLYRIAKTQILKSLYYSYRDRKKKKTDFRSLWNVRINAAVRPYGLNYSTFIHRLNEKNIKLNRKVLSNIALEDPEAFGKIVEVVK
ncbi:MAG TPA: 50S ribosomal protein L20 [Exilispira sp.]|nr:50S ribosomal protein L20 [Exilispira sp.]